MDGVKGIDISNWQARLDIYDLVLGNQPPEFVIARIGGSDGGGSGKAVYEDSSWRKFYMQCKMCGIPFGSYYYATNNVDIDEQVAFCLSMLRDTQMEYPFFLDVEDRTLLDLPKSRLTDYVARFLDAVEKDGYYVGIYASASTWHYNFDTPRLERFDFFPAIWNGGTPKDEGMTQWQLHQTGTEKWGNFNLDTDICYKPDYPNIIKSNHLNNFKGVL